MRKKEMSQEELKTRTRVIKILRESGWEGPFEEDDFDKGLWLESEVSMAFENRNLELEIEHSTEMKTLYLLLSSKSEGDLQLIIRYENQIEAVLHAIVAMQYDITPDNFRVKIRSLLKVCKQIEVDDGEQTYKLVDG